MRDYTSGPWTYKPFGAYGQQDILGAPDKGGYKLNIATVHNAGSAEAREANACLIASAPDLLDATKLLLAALHEGHGDWIEKASARGLAAIKKAEEGKS